MVMVGPLNQDTKQMKTSVEISVNMSTNNPSVYVSPHDLQISQT